MKKPAASTKMDSSDTVSTASFVRRFWAWFVLLIVGAAWGYSISLAKMVMAEGAHPLGVTLWTSMLGAGFLIAYSAARRRPISVKPNVLWLYVVCGLLGVVLPAIFFFYAASRLPVGVLSITTVVGPILTFLLAAFLGLERFASLRVLGVAFGALAVVLLVAPEASLPDPTATPWVLLACGPGVCYALENMVLTFRMPKGTSSFMIVCGNYLVAAIVMVPVVIATDSFVPLAWPWGTVEWAIVGMAAISAVCYSLFIYLLSYSGAVFATQVAYLVTIFGVTWGMIIFGERHSVWIWLSLAVMLAGLTLIRPRKHERAAD